MVPMLVLLGMMLLLSINEGIREGLADAAGTVIEPVLPYDGEFFVLTVFLVGTTKDGGKHRHQRGFHGSNNAVAFIPQEQGNQKTTHGCKKSRDTARMKKMNRLQMEMTPESAKMTSMTMKPMMYTIVFVIGIFTWIGYSVEEFRVTYVVSLEARGVLKRGSYSYSLRSSNLHYAQCPIRQNHRQAHQDLQASQAA